MLLVIIITVKASVALKSMVAWNPYQETGDGRGSSSKSTTAKHLRPKCNSKKICLRFLRSKVTLPDDSNVAASPSQMPGVATEKACTPKLRFGFGYRKPPKGR